MGDLCCLWCDVHCSLSKNPLRQINLEKRKNRNVQVGIHVEGVGEIVILSLLLSVCLTPKTGIPLRYICIDDCAV